MNPGSLFLLAALTGMSILPSRTDTPASLSTMPSSCAFFRMAVILLEMVPSFSLRDLRMEYSSSDAVSFTSPYLSRIPSILLCISGKLRMRELILLRFGYTPSFMPSKNEVTFLSVSSIVLSLRSDSRSIADELLSSGLRKSMQSMNPPDGNPSSNIIMRRISSVRSSLLRMCAWLVEKVSVAVLSTA